MKCILTNSCVDRNLCCSYCGDNKCDQRCKNNPNECKWFEKSSEYKKPKNSKYLEKPIITQKSKKIIKHKLI